MILSARTRWACAFRTVARAWSLIANQKAVTPAGRPSKFVERCGSNKVAEPFGARSANCHELPGVALHELRTLPTERSFFQRERVRRRLRRRLRSR